ncbi:HAT1-interacting factor 1, partial [Phenoliferia sp. Uapishka_3]
MTDQQPSTAVATPDAPTESTSDVTTTPAEPAPAPVSDSQSLLAQGIKALALKKYEQACESLSRAVEALTDLHGELAPEAAEAMVLYGKALLNNAIAQSAVLGGGPGKAEETEEAVQNAVAGPSTTTGPVTAQSIQFHFGGDAEDEEEGEGDEEEDGEDEEAHGDKDDDLETAFLMLDTARAIYSKIETKEAKLKLGDVHRLLGDVATEDGTSLSERPSPHSAVSLTILYSLTAQFENAVTEYTSALSVLSTILEPFDRSLSELHMLIALALDFVPEAVDRAVSHAEKAKNVLLLKLESLEKLDTKSDKDEREILDIKSLMGDLDMKIEDLKVVPEAAPKTESEKTLEALIGGVASRAGASGVVNNLNSLVKRKKPSTVPAPDIVKSEESNGGVKRKAEEPPVEGEAMDKKAKVEEVEVKEAKIEETKVVEEVAS